MKEFDWVKDKPVFYDIGSYLNFKKGAIMATVSLPDRC
jgi:hypothetical protein